MKLRGREKGPSVIWIVMHIITRDGQKQFFEGKIFAGYEKNPD